MGKKRDKAPESMIIPCLKHITKIQNKRGKVKCFANYFHIINQLFAYYFAFLIIHSKGGT